MEENRFMKEALLLAEEAAQEGEVPVGAVVVYQGEIISRGRNRRETGKNAAKKRVSDKRYKNFLFFSKKLLTIPETVL